MPYIPLGKRRALDTGAHAGTPGELNYQITRIIVQYLEDHPVRYDELNAIVGAVENAKAEFLRRVVAPYEDAKCRENGDVYPAGIL